MLTGEQIEAIKARADKTSYRTHQDVLALAAEIDRLAGQEAIEKCGYKIVRK